MQTASRLPQPSTNHTGPIPASKPTTTTGVSGATTSGPPGSVPAGATGGAPQGVPIGAKVGDIFGGVVPVSVPKTKDSAPASANANSQTKVNVNVIGTSKALSGKTAPTATINTFKTVVVPVWNLNDTSPQAPDSFEAAPSVLGNYSVGEAVFGRDDRKKVPAADFGPGGKYQAIVKLFLTFQGKTGPRNLIGTGWLIAPDVVVTAAHCSYDWDHHLRQVCEVKAFIGYNGKASVGTNDCQFSKGIRVATTSEWLKSGQSHYDVSFIKLHKPFVGVTPIKYVDTPRTGNEILGVVGYPGDLDHGEHMYECFQPVKFDTVKGKGMLQYQIDTFGGNSGAPVIRQKDGVSIGVHVMGGTFNQASLIGALGNHFPTYVQCLQQTDAKMAKKALEVSLLQVRPAMESANEASNFQADAGAEAIEYSNAPETGEAVDGNKPSEGLDPSSQAYHFRDIVRSASMFTRDTDLLSPRYISLGPSGRVAACYGSAILRHGCWRAAGLRKPVTSRSPVPAVGQAPPESEGLPAPEAVQQEADEADETLAPGVVARSVLAEACIEALMSLDQKTLQEQQVIPKLAKHTTETFGFIKQAWASVKEPIKLIACGVASSVMSAKINASMMPKSETGEASTEDAGATPAPVSGAPLPSGIVPPASIRLPSGPGNGAATSNRPVDKLLAALLNSRSAAGVDPSLVSMIKGPSEAFSEVMGPLNEALLETEAAAGGSSAPSKAAAVDEGMAARIALGEAALNTVLEMMEGGAGAEAGGTGAAAWQGTEGFFGDLWDGIKKVGSCVASVLPAVLPGAAGMAFRIIKPLLSKKKKESGTGSGVQMSSGGSREAEVGGGTGPQEEGIEGELGSGGEAGNEEADEADEAIEAFEGGAFMESLDKFVSPTTTRELIVGNVPMSVS